MYNSPIPWSPERPRILVVACSDGRFEQHLDDFLVKRLQISWYDRLYLPGGPGALATSGFEFLRVDQSRRECRFLLEAHQIEEVILLFHGCSEDGPGVAMCADYVRKLPARSIPELRTQQEDDAQEVAAILKGWSPELTVYTYRAEVGPQNEICFVKLQE